VPQCPYDSADETARAETEALDQPRQQKAAPADLFPERTGEALNELRAQQQRKIHCEGGKIGVIGLFKELCRGLHKGCRSKCAGDEKPGNQIDRNGVEDGNEVAHPRILLWPPSQPRLANGMRSNAQTRKAARAGDHINRFTLFSPPTRMWPVEIISVQGTEEISVTATRKKRISLFSDRVIILLTMDKHLCSVKSFSADVVAAQVGRCPTPLRVRTAMTKVAATADS